MAVDLLAIEPTKIATDLVGRYILLYGEQKAGKTSFAVQAPKNLLVGFEIGWNALSGVKAIPCPNWKKFKEILKDLRRPEVREAFSTVSIDTVGLAYSCCEEWVCQQNGISEISEIPYGGGFKILKREFRETFREITMLG